MFRVTQILTDHISSFERSSIRLNIVQDETSYYSFGYIFTVLSHSLKSYLLCVEADWLLVHAYCCIGISLDFCFASEENELRVLWLKPPADG